MGPEGSTLPSYSQHFSNKVPPTFDGQGDYQAYRENILLWEAMTTVALQRRGPTIIGQLSGLAQATAKTSRLSELTTAIIVSSLLDELDKKFGSDNTILLHNNISNFFDFVWDDFMSLDEFVLGFHSRLGRISKLKLSDDLTGHQLPRQANL